MEHSFNFEIIKQLEAGLLKQGKRTEEYEADNNTKNKREGNDNGDTLKNECNMVIIVYLLWFEGECALLAHRK